MSGKPFDATMKDLIEADPAAWAARLCGPVSAAELIDSELSTVTAAADKVIRIRQPWGETLVNVEPESSSSRDAPEQLLLYSAALNRRHDVPVRSVLLLLRPSAESEEASGVLEKYHRRAEDRAPGELPYLVFRYEVERLGAWSVESLLAGPLPLAALAPLTDEEAGDMVGVVARAVRRMEAETEPERADRLERALTVLMQLRYGMDFIEEVVERVCAMEETAFDRFIARKGEERGKELAVREVISTLLELGPEKCGSPDEATVRAIEAVNDLDRLRRMRSRLWKVTSWSDLMSTP
jgi:predicted transposase YdaD